MQASFEMDHGRAALQGIVAEFPPESPHWNEAQNRFQFIDRLLVECLGWEQPFIGVEHFDDGGGRADYLLGKPVRAALEAKREARAFKFLPTAKPRNARKLRPLVDACAVLKDACVQVVGYCALHGARLAIVCNGPQMVIFLSVGQGASPLDGQCMVFDGFKSYIDRFDDLWRVLSPEGVYENFAARVLAELQNPRLPAKASTIIPDVKQFRYRTSFQENLRTLGAVLLEDVEYNPDVKSDFYRECYVSVYKHDEELLLSESLISSRYKRVTDDGIIPANISTTIEDGVVKVVSGEIFTNTGRPIVVVGDVGVGKTSFFEHLFQQLDEKEKSRTCYIHVNLGQEGALAQDVRSYFLYIVPLVLREEYGINIDSNDFAGKLYSPEIDEFDDGVEGQLKKLDPLAYAKARIRHLADLLKDRASHVHRSLNYIVKGLERQVMIVLDNADQRTFDTQQQAFLVAQELASSRSMLIFVALRPSTFYASKLSGALSGYKNEVLSISPPPAHEVIRKRLIFALNVAAGNIAPAALEGVSLNLSSIALFLNALLNSIRQNKDIKTFLGNITGGNTRLALELITSFCGSPNVEAERIVQVQGETGRYSVPLHEFTKHALLGDYAYYNPTSSLVGCNVFDISVADKREHFLGSLIVGFIASPTGIRNNDGFILGSVIMTEMMRMLFTENQVRAALRRLAEHRLIETPHAHYREIQVADGENVEAFTFRATSIGLYHVKYWIGSFSFLDATCLDTPVLDEEARAVIMKHAISFEIKHRYAKTSAFLRYLQGVWYDSNFDVGYFDFKSAIDSQARSFDSVARYVAR